MLNHVQEHCKGSKNLVKIACGIWQGPNEIQNTLWIKNKCFWTFYFNFFFFHCWIHGRLISEKCCVKIVAHRNNVCVFFFIPFLPHLCQKNSNDMTEKNLWVDSPDTESLFIVPYTPSHNLLSLLCKWRGDAMRFGGWGGCPALQRKQHSCPVRIWHILAAQGTTSWPTGFTVSNCQIENPHV